MTSPPHITHPALAAARHGFFGREGGVSQGIYASLNVGRGSSDNPAHIEANRERVQNALGATALATCHQTHSAIALSVRDATTTPKADALVTTQTGLAIGVLTADCAPVLFLDAVNGVVGASHAGWRGAWEGIIGATVDAMQKQGAELPHIQAVIGPCISRYAYEVGAEFATRITARYPQAESHFASGHFDLPAFVRDRLLATGLDATQIHAVALCTYWQAENYFSYRRTTHNGEADYGRQIAAICL